MEALKTNPQTEHELGDESFMSAAELGAYTAKLKAAKALQTEDRAEEARAELIKALSETIEVTPKKVHARPAAAGRGKRDRPWRAILTR